MKLFKKTTEDGREEKCGVCVHSSVYGIKNGVIFCTEKKKNMSPEDRCRKFSLDITTVTARRRRTPKKVNPEDFSID